MLRWLICWAPIVQRAGSQWQVHWTLIVMLAVLTSQDIMILKHVLKRTMIFCNFGIFAFFALIRDVADPDAMVGDIQVLAGREGKGEILEALDPSRAVSARGWSSRYCVFSQCTLHVTQCTCSSCLYNEKCAILPILKNQHIFALAKCATTFLCHIFSCLHSLSSQRHCQLYTLSRRNVYTVLQFRAESSRWTRLEETRRNSGNS